MTTDENSLRDIARDTAEKMAALRDELQVKLHLAGMDAHDSWKKAEPGLVRAEKRLREALDLVVPGGSDKVRLELQLGLMEAKDRVRELEPTVRQLGDAVTDAAKTGFAKLKENLTKLGPKSETPPAL